MWRSRSKRDMKKGFFSIFAKIEFFLKHEAEKEIGPKFHVSKPRQIMIKEGCLLEEDGKYNPISCHKFREESKDRWVGNAFRF